MIPITKSVIAPSSQLFKSISDFSFGFRLFLLLICFSPPYGYIISYGAPYVKNFQNFFADCMKLSMCISNRSFFQRFFQILIQAMFSGYRLSEGHGTAFIVQIFECVVLTVKQAAECF